MPKKWYSVELPEEIAVEFRRFLQDRRFSHVDISPVRFEVFLSPEDLAECDEFLTSLFVEG